MSDAVLGEEVDGYRIQSVLGRGGMGVVYRAEDVNLARTVAIKRINPGQADREAFIHRFRSEAQALARIDSPHIVSVHALRETDIGLLIVMEYVEGGTLQGPMSREGAMAPHQAVPILEQMLRAFRDAHSAGVIHRDIKPQNIMLTQEGVVKVTDFGIAKLRQPDSGETVTQGGQGGTLKYMSPEQISSIDDVDARSDLYSIGMTAYEMLAGQLPFTETDTDFDIMRKVVEGDVPPPDEFNADIPSGLAQWVRQATAKAQGDRYQDADAMLSALQEADEQRDKTVTQPEWEVAGEDADAEATQTAVTDDPDRTETVVPDADEDAPTAPTSPSEPTRGATGGDEPSFTEAATQTGAPPEARSTSSLDGDEGDDADPEQTWGAVKWAGIAGAALTLVIGGYLAYAFFAGTGSPAEFSLTTTPSGATVLVEGDSVGTTPIVDQTVAAGPTRIAVRQDGEVVRDTQVTLSAGQSLTFRNLTLADEGMGSSSSGTTSADGGGDEGVRAPTDARSAEASEERSSQESSVSASASAGGTSETGEGDPAMGRVAVSVEPRGSATVDGTEQVGTAPIPVEAGQHTLTCRHPSHGTIDTTVTVRAEQTNAMSCHFARTVNVTTTQSWGSVWVDGEQRGQTPAELTLAPGTHDIAVKVRSRSETFSVGGGLVRTERGGRERTGSFGGTTYTLEVTPTFEPVKHALVFEITRD